MNGTIKTVFFSPTGTGAKVLNAITAPLCEKSGAPLEAFDLTLPAGRAKALPAFTAEDLLILEFPVYGGRIPGILLDSFGQLKGQDTPAVIVATYGNRHYDDAMLEAADLLDGNGFKVIAAAAFIGEHSLTAKVAAGRPDASDLEKAAAFGGKLADKLAQEAIPALQVWGHRPYKAKGAPAKLAPKTNDNCTNCGLCAAACPQGIISSEDPKAVGEGCINCHACEKVCPVQAKYFDQEGVLKVIGILEANCMARREPELFL